MNVPITFMQVDFNVQLSKEQEVENTSSLKE